MLWYLWSQNRQEVLEGTYTRDTALSLHELSDIMPSSVAVFNTGDRPWVGDCCGGKLHQGLGEEDFPIYVERRIS